jgi:hypothetical protein
VIGTAADTPGAGYKFGSTYTLTQNGTAQSFSFYARGSGSAQSFTPVVYRVDANGLPSSLVVKGAEVTIAALQSPGWVTSTLPATSLTAGTYLLGLMSGPNSAGASTYYNAVQNGGFWNQNTYPTAPATWGQINRENSAFSFYVTYTPAATGPPANTAPPVISGTTTVGNQLTASTGTWSGAPGAFTYQWRRCDSAGNACSDIAGAGGSTYTLVAGDVGSTLRVAVTATNGAGSAVATSAATAVIAPAPPPPPANTVLPAISGTPINGQALTATDGTWTGNPTGFAYQWRRCDSAGSACSNISGADKQTYTLTGTDVGRTLRIVVTAIGAGGSSSATSNASPLVADAPAPPSNTAPPTVSGSAVTGQALTGTLGTWTGSPAPSLAAQWQSCQGGTCSDIPGAQGGTYVVGAGDVGKTLRVVVTATNASGTATAASAQTQPVTSTPPFPVTKTFGASAPGTLVDQPGAGYKFAGIYRLQETGKLVDFRFYARGGSSQQSFVAAIYSTAAGVPNTLIVKSPVVTVAANSAAAWRTASLPTGVTLQPGDYALALLPGPNSERAFIYYEAVSGNASYWNNNGWPNPSAAWGAVINAPGTRWSFQVTYETTP